MHSLHDLQESGKHTPLDAFATTLRVPHDVPASGKPQYHAPYHLPQILKLHTMQQTLKCPDIMNRLIMINQWTQYYIQSPDVVEVVKNIN